MEKKTRTKKKRYDRFFIEEFFEKPWCSLFGHIFWNDETLPPSSQIERCFNIIQEARRLWRTEDSDGIDRSDGWHGPHSWPEPEEIPDYPKDLILAAREISRCWNSIYQYSVLHSQQPDAYYEKDNGEFEPKHTLDTVWDKAIYIAKSICHAKDIQDIPGFAILAILAIREARRALRLIVKDGESEDNSKVIKHVQVAGSLLAHAKSEEYNEEIKFMEKKTKEMQPLVEYGKKFKDGPKKPRNDCLNKYMIKTYLELKKKGKKPTAKEVFDALPLNKCIQEIVDNKIWWKNRYREREATEYKTFLNRFTKIKKELQ